MRPATDTGSAFGPYILDRRLGEGGMATVWLARRRGPAGFERQVVIKRIAASLTHDPQIVKMFLAEARLAARLNHPHIVQVFELGEVDGQHYIAMEYVDGLDLGTIMSRMVGRPIPVGFCAEVMAETCRALAHAHASAIVHRDVSPSNVFISLEGMVKLGDFGIAKLLGDTSDERTQTGVIKGKASYMPPEQLAGGDIDHRADVYSAGVVLHELVSGKRLFKAHPGVHPLAAREKPPPSLREARPEVPKRLDVLCRRALAPNAADRLGDIAEMAGELEQIQLDARWTTEDLRAFLRQLPEQPEAVIEAQPPPAPRRRSWLALPVAAAAVVGALLWLRPFSSPPVATPAPSDLAVAAPSPPPRLPASPPLLPASPLPEPPREAPIPATDKRHHRHHESKPAKPQQPGDDLAEPFPGAKKF